MRKKSVKELSPKRLGLLSFIDTFLREKKYAPSIREMCDAFKISSTSVLSYDLDEMKSSGLVDWVFHQSRTIHLTKAGEIYLASHRFETPKKSVNVAAMLNSNIS